MKKIEKEKLDRWIFLSKELKKIKDEEMKLRKEIVKCFCKPGSNITKVLKTLCFDKDGDLINELVDMCKKAESSYQIKAEAKLITKFDFEEFEEIKDSLDEDEIACVVYKPALNNKALNNLSATNPDSEIFELITKVPGAPSLSIEKLDE